MKRPRTVRALAPAKVNLWLEVLGSRADGYHEIDTWMLALDLCDRIEARASPRGGVTIAVTGPQASVDVPASAENLASRAALAAIDAGIRAGRIGRDTGVDLVLEKHVPSRAGLGGGSSDAAAAWLASCAALGLDLPAASSQAELTRLGADCAFFFSARETGSGRCEGIGERVGPAPAPSGGWSVALLTPDLACATEEIYAAFDALPVGAPAATHLPIAWREMSASSLRPFLFNRLEAPALAAFPALAGWRALLDESGAEHWRLSGSGSSFFGLYDRPEEAEAAVERLRGAVAGSGRAVRALGTARPAGHGASIVELG